MSIAQRATAVLGVALALTLGMSAVASAAEQQVVRGRYLELVSIQPDGADRLSPGVTVDWRVGISAPGAAGGSIERTVQVGGDLAQYLQVSVSSCTGPAAEDCTGGSTLVPPSTLAAGQRIDLGSQDADEQQWLLVQVRLPEDAPAGAQSLTGSLRLTARGAGEELVVTPDGDASGGETPTQAENEAGTADEIGSTNETGPIDELPPLLEWLPGTGVQPALWLLAAGAAVLVGAALRSQRRAHPAEDETDEWSRA